MYMYVIFFHTESTAFWDCFSILTYRYMTEHEKKITQFWLAKSSAVQV